jgi:hypothetical protein
VPVGPDDPPTPDVPGAQPLTLPGGSIVRGELRRDGVLTAVDGHLELALAAARERSTRVAQVTAALTIALLDLGGAPPTPDRVADLGVEDRRWLTRRLALALGGCRDWITLTCDSCDEPFDAFVDQAALPVRTAGPTYPRTTARTSAGEIAVRVPTGADQETITDAPDATTALLTLLRRCVVGPVADDGAGIDALGDDDLDAIETALAEVAPDVPDRVAAPCPTCGSIAEVPAEPERFLEVVGADIVTDVHRLASAYHWSESEVLALPRARRLRYLELIEVEPLRAVP